ncbi:apoptosis regulatory protein Siva-like [Drosophila teissieri]|uniref:apoptosis regulatory protein Siva-like n=1 Tax=Drosophila teissieri TaxID=7243 RepID=UPI001CB9E262|nr:apoptosis regulatory protein Siva-like [Drosophila teissieri]
MESPVRKRAAKRSRSADGDANNNLTQRKVFVNQKMSDSRDPQKMKEVHEKTTKMLFDGAAGSGQGQGQNPLDPLNPLGAGQEEPALCEQYQLLGDGTIILRNLRTDLANPRLERHKSRCCQRQTLVHDTCVNCMMDLCEECGYSCVECSKFICRSCVTLFGNRADEGEDPLCERCQMFFT